MAGSGPQIDRTRLFEAGKGGYATYRIPGIVVTTRGTVLAYCEARRSGRGDWGSIDILMRRSEDGGATWTTPLKVNEAEYEVAQNPVALQQNLATSGERTYNNPVAIVDREAATVHLLHCVEYARCYSLRSEDDGHTFSDPVDITSTFEAYRPEYNWRVLATGPGHGIQLANGRLLVPVWLSTGQGGHGHRPSCVSVIYSDDQGRTWERGEIAVRHPEPENPSETVALQLHDGRVSLNIRSESPRHRRLVTVSEDGVSGWSLGKFDEALFEPVCFASILRLSKEPRNRILFVHPDSQASPKGANEWGAWPRENLTVRMSYDEGQTWPVSKTIDPGISGYADLAVGPSGTIYCFYEGGGIGGDMFHNAHMTVVRFNLEWLTDGEDSLDA